jgi:beta-mannosidase
MNRKMKKIVLYLMLLGIFTSCKHEKKTIDKKEAKVDLTQNNWQFKSAADQHWLPATVPGTVHTDLLDNGIIHDPFFRLNEKKLQWIDKIDWEYRTEFLLDDTLNENELSELTFEGLDTYAEVFLNDKLILQTDNMFRTYKVDVTNSVLSGINELRINFLSPINKGLELLANNQYQLPATNDQSENGEMADKKVSPFVRKAPYHFGWDWGPRLVTSGIWKPIYLTIWNKARIKELFVNQLDIKANVAEIQIHTVIEAAKYLSLSYKIIDVANNQLLASDNLDLEPGNNHIKTSIAINNPKLWWPNGHGEQNLYKFKVELYNGNDLLATKTVKTGLRSIKVVREPDAKGKSFYFEVNGLPVFAKGANYIPNDNFVTRVSNQKYMHILQSAVDANMNMIRVWGGGIYEYDRFYELCDSLGLMVWQDFMFACSMYPGNDDFIESVRLEAIDNVKRLRNHPSIALWCGNNEIETAWGEYDENWGWGWKQLYTAYQRKQIWHAYDTLFYSVLPQVVKEFHTESFYWPSSPAADFRELAGYENTSGDMHYWGVWHGKEKFERFNEVIPRFMSEYGFQSFPDFTSVKKYTIEEDWNIESDVMVSHQRSGIGNLRIKEYMGWDYRIPTNFEHFLYVGQVLQAEGMKTGIEAHRRNKPYCMGTLYWQLNDCWPVASWSSIDYYGKWKAMHYFVKDAYKPYAISMLTHNKKLEVWLISDKRIACEATLELTLLNFNGKELYKKSMEVNLSADTSFRIHQILLEKLMQYGQANNQVLLAELRQGNEVLASNRFYFVKPKNLALQKVKPQMVFSNGKLEISSNVLIKNVYLFTDDEAVFGNNYFDVLPGKNYIVDVKPNTNTAFDVNRVKFLSLVDTY